MRTIEAVEAGDTGKMPQSIEHIWRPARIGRQVRGRHSRQTSLISVSQSLLIIPPLPQVLYEVAELLQQFFRCYLELSFTVNICISF